MRKGIFIILLTVVLAVITARDVVFPSVIGVFPRPPYRSTDDFHVRPVVETKDCAYPEPGRRVDFHDVVVGFGLVAEIHGYGVLRPVPAADPAGHGGGRGGGGPGGDGDRSLQAERGHP